MTRDKTRQATERATDEDALELVREREEGDSPAEAVQISDGDGGAPPSYERQASGFVGEEDDTPRDSLSKFISQTGEEVEDVEEVVEDSYLPRQPRTLVDLGLSKAFLTDLALKIVHYSGTPTIAQLTRRLGVGPNIVQHLLAALTEERLIEVLSQSDLYTGNYRYRLSDRGHTRVNEALERTRYAGPAPVTAEQYSEVIRRAHAAKLESGRAHIKSIAGEMVLSSELSDSISRALYSGKAGIFYGPSGNGKTTILERYANTLEGVFLVPYSIYAYGQVIRVFDQSIHEPIDEPDAGDGARDATKFDRRWVLVKRPAISLGAEMGRESLDLAYDPQSRFYQAPPHIKAQGGVLIVDDFGRQKIEARELLTRWLIPLERGWDTLALITGEKVTVPFDVQLMFGTNMRIKKLADDALLRRILYKVEIPNPTPDEFMEIMRQTCRKKKVLVEDGAIEYVARRLYDQPDLKTRASYARDLLDMIIESARYDGGEPVLDNNSFDRVFKMFVAVETESDEEDEEGYED